MKRAYQKPSMEVTEFRFAEHIAASPSSCVWHNGDDYSLGYVGCKTTFQTGTGYWTGNAG